MSTYSFNADLIDDLARQRVIPFIGSGVSASALTRAGQRLKTWRVFLEDVAKQVKDREQKRQISSLIKEKDFLLAAELLRGSLDDKWSSALREEFAQVAQPSDLHRAIISLSQRIVVTTNFDKLLENAWNDATVSDTHYPNLIFDLDAKTFKLLRDNQHYLIKLHGTIDDEKSMIFTKSDYTKNAYGNWAYTELMNNLLINYTFLFIGFSMSDPAITLLVELYTHRFSESRPHYIFLPEPISAELQDISKRLRKLYIIPYSPAKNHLALTKYVIELGEQARKRAQILKAETFRPASKKPTKRTPAKTPAPKKAKAKPLPKGTSAKTPAPKKAKAKPLPKGTSAKTPAPKKAKANPVDKRIHRKGKP